MRSDTRRVSDDAKPDQQASDGLLHCIYLGFASGCICHPFVEHYFLTQWSVACNILLSACRCHRRSHRSRKLCIGVAVITKRNCWKTVKPAVRFSSLNLHSLPGTFTTIVGLNMPGSSAHFTTKLVQVHVYAMTNHQKTVVAGT